MVVQIPSRQRVGNLPAEVTSFVGRRQLIAEARRLMSATRLVTFTGPGGIGKTRLALRVAGEVRRAFSDGVWLVELAGLRDEELVARTVATALGLRDQSDEPAVDALLDHLADQRVLLVLDNCEHVLDGVAMLARKLLGGAGRLQIVATSRQPLGVEGEHILQVPPLTAPRPGKPGSSGAVTGYEAVNLFADRARAAYSAFTITPQNGEQVALLCRRLSGIPLAIELAAVRVRSLTVDQILDRLNDRFALLTGGGRAVPPRQRTLRAALDWSLDLCSPDERAMWSRLSVFTGGFDLEDAEEVCSGDGIDRNEVFDLVANLADKSILYRDEGRYGQLEPIHEYGAGLLARSGEEARLRARHADWYRRMATRAEDGWLGPDQVRWLARLQREKANLRSAMAYCVDDPGRARTAMGLISALWNYWIQIFGSYAEGTDRLGRALARDPVPSMERTTALWVWSWFALRQGAVDAAAESLAESRALAERLGDTFSIACTTHFRGLIAFFRGEIRDAVTLLEEADERYRAEGSTPGSWMANLHLIMASSTAGDHERAGVHSDRCLSLCETRSAYLSRSNALWAIGYGRWLQGDQGRAAAFLADGLRMMRETGDTWGVAECLEVLAWIAAADGRFERGARLLGAARGAWRSSGSSIPGFRPLAASHDRYEAILRDRLGAAAFADAVRAGDAADLDAAVAYALDEAETSETAQTRETAETPGTPRRAGGTEHRLTRRELQIAELIAQGMRNKDIAATLVIAQRTAEGHVERILQKLGFTSRVQIAGWVVDRRRAEGGPGLGPVRRKR